MNTEDEQPKKPAPFQIFIKKSPAESSVDRSAAALELQLQQEQDKRKEERFYWIFAITILALPKIFDGLSIFVTILMALLIIVFLLGLAKWLGLDHVAVPLQQMFNKYIRDDSQGKDAS